MASDLKNHSQIGWFLANPFAVGPPAIEVSDSHRYERADERPPTNDDPGEGKHRGISASRSSGL
jgi:hypothetical protein